MTDGTQQVAAATDTNNQAAASTNAVADTNLLNGQNSQDNAGKQGAAQEAAKQGEQADVVPETYQPFTMPEGLVLDETSFKDFTGLAKELGLSQDKAQKVADIGSNLVSRVTKSIEEQTQAKHAEQVSAWKNEVITDKDIGGDKLQATLAVANTFLSEFGSPKLTETLEKFGLTNNPEVIKMFAKAGKAVLPEKVLTGDAPAPVEQSAAKTLFPTMN